MNGKTLGERIAAFREQQGVAREELAERTGLSTDFLSELEEADVSPSLGPLLKISRALGVRLGTFMDAETSGDLCLVRKADRRRDETVMRRERDRAGLVFHSLGRGKSDRNMEPFFVELFPEADPDAEQPLSSHEGEEFIICVTGRVKVVLGRDQHTLDPGDSIYFNSITPHHVGCAGREKAEIHAVLYFPK